ncbi:hypothetical protein ES703_01110 [subsurface metagenome]
MKNLGDVVKPRFNVEKYKYPKCFICIDNSPTQSINLPEAPPLSQKTFRDGFTRRHLYYNF